MKHFVIIFFFAFSVMGVNSQNYQKLKTFAYNWDSLQVQLTNSGERRQIFEGTTNELTYFEAHVTTLNPGEAPHGSHVHSDMEELIIVKEGLIEQNINGNKKVLGPGSVILALPGDEHGIWNAGKTKASYYIIRWSTGEKPNFTRAKESGGSGYFDWKEIEFKTTDKGGKRQFMQRPTAFLGELEMHVTTLNPGITSHSEHTHESEEIILVIKGEVEESINGTPHQLGPGSMILLMDNIPHGIRNIGKGQCEYFAFKWER